MELVQHYLEHYKEEEEKDIEHYKKCTSFEHLLKRAIASITPEGKRHPHKFRIPKHVMRRIFDYLSSKKEEFENSSSFEEVLEVVYSVRLTDYGKGFASLSIYDTALYIGSYYNIYPHNIYLHAGAEVGAKGLLGSDNLKRVTKYFKNDKEFPYVTSDCLPEELQVLPPYHIENFLCIYKNELHQLYSNKELPIEG